jgi:hypothetical protein
MLKVFSMLDKKIQEVLERRETKKALICLKIRFQMELLLQKLIIGCIVTVN